MRLVILLLAAIITFACGGGAGTFTSAKPTLPPFDRYATDLFTHPREGTIGEPLRIAQPPCPLMPFPDWQGPLCTLLHLGVWSGSNAAGTTLDEDRWRTVVNVEQAWDTNCNTGPPAQSLALIDPHVVAELKPTTAVLGIQLANESDLCSKIPYVALTYIRGVQGDRVMRFAAWGSHPKLSFDGAVNRTIGPTFAQAVHFWVHLRTTDGTRFMAHTHLWQSGYEPPDFRINWNWPAIDSYYFPGAWIHGGDSETCPGAVVQAGARFAIDLESLASCRFPEFAMTGPDILGFEIAVEGAYLDYVNRTGLPNRLTFAISNLALQ